MPQSLHWPVRTVRGSVSFWESGRGQTSPCQRDWKMTQVVWVHQPLACVGCSWRFSFGLVPSNRLGGTCVGTCQRASGIGTVTREFFLRPFRPQAIFMYTERMPSRT